MTERGLPIVDGAPACPFVAFDDDRDERSTSPDHRHRCYAESPPAPRALAHQEAYCLASAFPVCPTFQDWARREAARSREPEPPPSEEDDAEPIVIDRPPRGRGGSGWNAPPPWLRRGGAADRGDSGDVSGGSPYAEDDPSAAADAGIAAGAAAAGIVGAAGAMGAAGSAAAGSGGAGSGGLSGSFADRLAAGGDVESSGPPPRPPERYADSRDDDEWDAQEEAPPPRAARTARGHERLDRGDPSEREEPGRGRDLGAPSWERPRRLEAYPTLRSRRLGGLGLPSLAIALIAVLLAALLLFFLPSLLGVGSGPAASSPTPSVPAASVPPASVLPTIAAAPTPMTYTAQSGDTFSRIANKFHVPLQALIDANKANFPDPNKLQIGDVLIIPTTTPTSVPAASASP